MEEKGCQKKIATSEEETDDELGPQKNLNVGTVRQRANENINELKEDSDQKNEGSSVMWSWSTSQPNF